MAISTLLSAAVIAAFLYAAVALAVLTARTVAAGHRPYLAEPAGSARAGVVHAFLRGMLPWEKESVSGHLPTFAAGLLYHAGVFLSLVYLFLLVFRFPVSLLFERVLAALLVLSLIAGIGLLVKRAALAKMRMISAPDDYIANLIVDIFLATALVATLTDGWERVFLAAAVVLFVYMPLGKIRHCVFFFYTRAVFGVFFGRRGVFPHPRHEV